jgi:transposase
MKKREIHRREVELKELEAILERAREALAPEDHDKLKAAVDTLAYLTRELEVKGTSVARLRRLIFGPGTEKTSRIFGDTNAVKNDPAGSAEADGAAEVGATASSDGTQVRSKRPGHGRNGASAYHGADKVKVHHESLTHGARCPACERGKVYLQAKPATLLRVKGMAPLQASVFELDRLRCNLCGEVFTADGPEGVGTAKYDETATGMIALLKYGCGLPFFRLEKLENSLGIPLPAATQWELVSAGAAVLDPVFSELIRQAAQGEVLHNDDTKMKILELVPPEPEEGSDERTGVFTSGIVSTAEGRNIALFFTGRQHAGENLQRVLEERARDLSPPIQMCDALSWNTSGEFSTIVASCLVHARRQFVDVAGKFPKECLYVLEALRDVYLNDAVARERGMSKADRLVFHRERSGPIMKRLEEWLRDQLEERMVEPNSGLGEAIEYMQKHWEKLTLFLRKAGAPLDNNICERALKRAILHRKNSMFYKTENGARVGDLYMTLILTTELAQEDPFDYLVTLLRHPRPVAQNPVDWMPWNYRETRGRISSGAVPAN